MQRRHFLAGAAALGGGAFAPGLALANVPTPFTYDLTPPMDSRDKFIAWGVAQRGEDPMFLGERFDRFGAMVRNEDIWDDRHKRAFLLTPREKFVLKQNLDRAYEHAFLDIGFGVTISGPHIVGRMTSTIDPKKGEKVLEIGTGSGYQSAYLAHLTYNVYTIEIIKPLAERTRATYDALIEAGYNEFKTDLQQERRRLLRLGGSGAVRQDHRHLRHRSRAAALAATAQARRRHGHSGRPARRAARAEGRQESKPTTARSPSRARTFTAAGSFPSCPSPSSRATPSRARTTIDRLAPSRPRRARVCRRARAPPGSEPSFMNDAIATADSAAPAIGADDEIALGGQSRLALYFAVGLGAGAVIALQIDIMRVFSVGSWAHFGSLVVSLAMLGFGLTSAVMCVAKDWFAAQLARRGERRARPVRAARGRRQSVRSATRLQRDLPRLRPRAEMEAARDLPRRADAVSGRRGVSRLRLPEEQPHLRARLFRRSGGLGPVRPRRPRGDVRLHAGQPHRGAAGAVVRGVPRLGASALGESARSCPMRRSPSSPSAAISSPRRPWG